jgi:predicted Fe-Mo cluster-binding NifX family protein
MKIAVTAESDSLDAELSSFFGRAPHFVLVDTETMESEACVNPGLDARGGAGIQAAQSVVQREVDGVLTGNVGPNAYDVLKAAHVPVYLVGPGTVRQAVEQFKSGTLQALQQATAQAHAGMGGWRHSTAHGPVGDAASG